MTETVPKVLSGDSQHRKLVLGTVLCLFYFVELVGGGGAVVSLPKEALKTNIVGYRYLCKSMYVLK